MSRFILSCILMLFLSASVANGQSRSKPIYLTGHIKDVTSGEPVAFANVTIPSARIGTVTDDMGEFRIQVFPKDSVVFQCVGYNRSYYKVPKNKIDSYTVFIAISQSSTLLGTIEVFPYGTEQEFKEAFLALDLEDERVKLLEKKLENRVIANMADKTGADGGLNHSYAMGQQSNQVHNQTFVPTLSLLNPFAWAKFIKSVKNGDLKKKK